MASAAHAGVSEDFAGCDGLMKPKSKDDGMRGVASLPGYSFSGSAGSPQTTIAACTRALTGGNLLPTQTIRRAHLLRARAAAKLRMGAVAEAVGDLDEAERAIASARGERFFDRSLGASLDLLRALATAQSGDPVAALPLADKAVAARPFALPLQLVAAMIRDAARSVDPKVPHEWDAIVHLDTTLGPSLIQLEASRGHFDGVLRIAELAPLAVAEQGDTKESDVLASLGRQGQALLSAARAGHHLAYAHAAKGRPADARTALEQAQATYARLTGAPVVPAATVATDAAKPKDLFADRRRMIEARIALAEGRVDEADKLAASPLPFGAEAIDLKAAIFAARDTKTVSVSPAAAAFEYAKLGQLADALLIAYESPRLVIDYQKSKPNVLAALVGAAFSMGTTLLQGVPKTSGFKETANPDGTITVEYLGSTPSATMVQEMTLLRAAEVTRATGKPGFALATRRDFTRYMTATQYGAVLSRTPAGHKTELVIRLLDTPEGARATGFETAAVIDGLGPLYYGK